MKKEISIDQWRDLTEEERKQIKLDNKVFIKKFAKPLDKYFIAETMPTIDKLIEYLGDDFHYILDNGDGYTCKLMFDDNTTHDFSDKELIDALWEALKYKIKDLDNK